MVKVTGRPIITQMVLLVAVAVALATVALFVVTFSGPPPFKAPVPLAAIAESLRTGDELPGRDVRRLMDRPSKIELRGLTRDVAAEFTLRRLGAGMVKVWGEHPVTASGNLAPDAEGDRNTELRGGFVVMSSEQGRPGGFIRPPFGLVSRWHLMTFGAMIVTFAVLTIAASLIARTIAGPLLRLADVADATRALPGDPAIPVDGPAEVRRVAVALARMRDRLAATLTTRTEMLTGIAHDMGTPLARLAFHLDVLPEVACVAAQAEIAEVRAMIGSVLDFARDTPPEFGKVDIAALLRQLVDETPVALAAPNIIELRGDAVALKRLFSNLIENALRYAGDCIVSLEQVNEMAVVRVADTGPGLPADIATLFEPFVRGEYSRSRATGGVGLGLAIARRIVEAHGGTINAVNRVASGAEFTVKLPLKN